VSRRGTRVGAVRGETTSPAVGVKRSAFKVSRKVDPVRKELVHAGPVISGAA